MYRLMKSGRIVGVTAPTEALSRAPLEMGRQRTPAVSLTTQISILCSSIGVPWGRFWHDRTRLHGSSSRDLCQKGVYRSLLTVIYRAQRLKWGNGQD